MQNYISLRVEDIFLRLLNFSENLIQIKREESALWLIRFDVPWNYCYSTCAAVKKCKMLLLNYISAPAIYSISMSSESPRSQTWHRYLKLDLIKRFNLDKFKILMSILMLLGHILYQFLSFSFKITFVSLIHYAETSSQCRKIRISDHFCCCLKAINLLWKFK